MDNDKKAILKALEDSCGVVSTACKAIDQPRSTFYKWMNDDLEFKKAVEELQDVAIDSVESALHTLIKKGDTAATIFYLKTKGKKRGYIEKQEIDANLSGSINLIFEQTPGCDPINDKPAS